jgi:hypothetical protein
MTPAPLNEITPYTYWLIKQGNEDRIYDWILENYAGINYWSDRVVIDPSLHEANMTGARFQNYFVASVFWFEHLNDPEVNVKFKLMNSDIILGYKHEKPNHAW